MPRGPAPLPSPTPVLVLQPNDVVLAEVVAGLDLDDDELLGRRILEAMLVARGNEGGLVGAHHELALAVHDLRRAGDHDPVLAAVMVELQGEARARLHLDALDLEAR